MSMLAIDLGSSFTKAALLENGSVQQERQLPTPPPLQTDCRRYEIDADVYFRQVQSLIDSYLDDASVKGILFSTQMHGYVLTDGAFVPCSPYVSWQDQMGAAYLPALRSTLSDADVYPSGVPLKGNLALCALLARQAEGDTPADGTLFHTLGGYMIARLTGRHVCHITNAAPTGLADIRRCCWNNTLLEKTGFHPLRMPEITHDLLPVGHYRGAAVYPDIGDQQVCAFGAKLQQEHSLHVNIGTAGLLGALCPKFKVDGCESRPWLEKGVYLRTVSGLPGGRHIQALRDEYPGDDDAVWYMLTRQPDIKTTAYYQELANTYQSAAEKMDFPIRELCYSGGCVLKNPQLRQHIEHAFHLSSPHSTHASDIWTGMIRLAEAIQKPESAQHTTNTNERIAP